MIIKLIFEGSIFFPIFYTMLIVFFSYALGLVVQTQFDYKKNNRHISIPLGFVVFQAMTFVFFLFPIAFNLGIFWFRTTEIIKESVIIFILIYFLNSWSPSFKVYGSMIKPFLLSGLLIILSLLTYFILDAFAFPRDAMQMSEKNGTVLFSLNEIYLGNQELYLTSAITNVAIFEKYETTYCWISILTKSSSSSSFSNETIRFLRYVIPVITIIITSNIVLANVLDSEKSYLTYFLSIPISISIAALLSWVGPNSKLFFILIIVLFLFFLLYDYYFQQIALDKSVTFMLLISLVMITITHLAIIFIVMFGALVVIASIEKKGQTAKNVLVYFTSLFIISLLFSVIFFIERGNIIGSTIDLFIILATFIMFTFKLSSLVNIPSKRSELVSFEKGIEKRLYLGVGLFGLLSAVVSAIYLIIYKSTGIIGELDNFFTIFDKWYIGLSVYLIGIIIPVLLSFFFKPKKPQIINSFVYLNILFNPVVLFATSLFLDINMNLLVLVIPSLILFVVWAIGLLVKRQPTQKGYN